MERKLNRSSSLRERFEDAGERFTKTLTIGREAMLDISSFVDPATVTESAERVLSSQDEVPEEKTEQVAQPVVKRSTLEAVGRSILEPANIVLRDKITFVVGVADLALTFFWLGKSPATYYHCWGGKSLLLFTLRWFTYKARGWHYMMLEFCYFANVLGAVHLYLYPQNAFMRKLAFAHMAGPLTWAIVAMRNSLVFHDFDKMTTLMMHASPAMVAWTMRWCPRLEWTASLSAAQLENWESAGWVEMALFPMGFYIAWVALYYLLTFLILAKRINKRGYDNMFTIMVLKDQAKKSALARLVLRAPKLLQPICYLSIHTMASWVAVLPTKLLWDHCWLHTAMVGLILLQSVWNGANFYFKVFAKRYMAELQAHEAKQMGKGGAPGKTD